MSESLLHNLIHLVPIPKGTSFGVKSVANKVHHPSLFRLSNFWDELSNIDKTIDSIDIRVLVVAICAICFSLQLMIYYS